ncbi:alpha/beta hydrolase [Bradyrhizobium sp. BR 10289]|uniref:alpha/beta fold hydrolase n=1 Tax=Bradyrhizobium sp. BR 10289 TaxID=2749993 RepID=UPI001C64C417|nr:alpha/beta hydrolase [Bradyrhizobium sp. BR 10289]MBW7972082.1 alpha/beta hydrolase [Bradyrhizobium sp. BR 10289]
MASELRKIGVSDDCELAVRIDDYLLPWDTRPPVVMLHGLAESGEAFRRWVPYFATHHLVVRPDLRGYGDSTPMQGDYVYRFAGLGDDIIKMLNGLKLDRVFLVGGKIGGTLAMHLTAKHPDRVIAVAAVGAPASLTSFNERAPAWRKQIREQGVEPWVRETTAGRLGSSLPPAALDWWIRLMSKTKASTLEAFLQMVPTVDVTGELPSIKRPALVITTTGSGLGDVASVKAWQETIPGSKLDVLPGDSYHVAATDPDVCARKVREFFDRVAT